MQQPQDDSGRFDARRGAFAKFGLVVSGLMLVAGAGLAGEAAFQLAGMPGAPVQCEGHACPEDTWVSVTDARWRCRYFIRVPGSPYEYVPIQRAEQPRLLATVDPDDDETCGELAAEGVIRDAPDRLASQLGGSVRVLWIGDGPGNQKGIIGIGAGFALLGLLCGRFYRHAWS